MPRFRFAALLLAGLAASGARAADHAVVFMYHHFGQVGLPATNIRLEQFEAHLEYLAAEDYTVWPLSRVVQALRSGETMPRRTVALTADDAYRSVMTEAWPRLKARGWPFTLFVATDQVDGGGKRLLNWDDVRRLRDEGMEIAAHSAAHGHMADMTPEEAAADFERANRRFRNELGFTPEILAYPYGEYSQALIDVARQAGYSAAFGQHSGPVGPGRPILALPRFALNERFGEPERFRTAASSLPLPVADPEPADTLLPAGAPAAIGFTLGGGVRPESLACFHSAATAPLPLRIEGRRISFEAPVPARPGRSRFNCTAPAGEGRFYWYGRQFVVKGGRD